tara:strand:+ start:730 stop:951 length:222 start_codon:yes stop_codon:yes gene_type:complete
MDRLARFLELLFLWRVYNYRRGAWRWDFLFYLRHDFVMVKATIKWFFKLCWWAIFWPLFISAVIWFWQAVGIM